MKQKKVTRKNKIVASKNVIQLKPEVQTQPEVVEQPAPQLITQEVVKMPDEAKKIEEPKVDAPKVEEPGWFSRNWKWVAGGVGVGATAIAIVLYIAAGKEIPAPDQISIPDQL